MLPHVIEHLAVSVDGRTGGFAVDLGIYYSLAARFAEDVTLAGSETILQADFPELAPESEPPPTPAPDTRPLLAVVDSRGRVRNWQALRNSGYWRDVLALCSEGTPEEYLGQLTADGVQYLKFGTKHVDLRAALEALHIRYEARVVRIESGGALNGALLRQSLVNEIVC